MTDERALTGIKELDNILNGGLIRKKSYLVKGGPGTGKSTLGTLFLAEGARQKESTMLITLGEPESDIRENAANQGIDLADTIILDMSPGSQEYTSEVNYSVFSPVEVEAQPIISKISEQIEKHTPDRVVLDSLTMLKYLYEYPFQYKNMALSFIRHICSTGATLMMISELHPGTDEEAEFWVDGVMEVKTGTDWRRIRVHKFRGSGFQGGDHAIKISGSGISVYPRLQPNIYDRKFSSEPLSSGISELDKMLHGGIEKGTISMFTGATGVGKTNLGIQFIKEASLRGERSVIYTFEESAEVIRKRSRLIGVPVDDMIEQGKLKIKSIEPFSFSPDEFSMMVRKDIDENGTEIVMLDSVGGYTLTVRQEDALARLHSLCTYMGNVGVTCFLISETSNITGDFITTNLHASYLADNIIFLRYLEMKGELKKSIGILKKRMSDFEQTIREFRITSDGIQLGEPMKNLQGILSGVPTFVKEKQ